MKTFKLAYKHGLIICPARIIGKGKPVFLRLALDTGSTKTMIPSESAISIGINPAHSNRTTEVTTGSGSVICPVIVIPRFSSLGFSIKHLDVVCHDLPFEGPVDGLLGLNFLEAFRLTLDFPKHMIEIVK